MAPFVFVFCNDPSFAILNLKSLWNLAPAPSFIFTSSGKSILTVRIRSRAVLPFFANDEILSLTQHAWIYLFPNRFMSS